MTEEEQDNDILYEAGAMEQLRVLDDDKVRRYGDQRERGPTLQIAYPLENENGPTQPQLWQFQNPKRLKNKIKKQSREN